MSIIEIENLTRDYGNSKGVFDVGFSVFEGESFGFLGPNGAGKTTTIRHLMGFLKPQKGKCLIGGLSCFPEKERIQSSVGYIPGEISFIDNMTGIEFIRFYAALRKQNNMDRVKQLTDRFDLDPNTPIKKMSKGTKQKVGIVCGFMGNPNIYILDEPTSGLDPLMQNRFIELINEEKKRGKTILMSSHIFEEVERTCSRVGIIKNGKLVAIDEIKNLIDQKTQKYIITLPNSEKAAAFGAELPEISEINGNIVTVSIKQDLRPLIEAMYKHPVQNIDKVNQSLENVFLHFYGGE